MDKKTLQTLEYPKVLERLARLTSFSASAEIAREVVPTAELERAREMQCETTEARRLLSTRPGTTIGGARDVRSEVDKASHGVVLDPHTLLDVKSTLISARELSRLFERMSLQFYYLTKIVGGIPQPAGLIASISQAISDRGEIQDEASPQLAQIRHDLRVVHDRLINRMQRMLTDPKIQPYLQDNLVTQRDGRYVIPLQADFKGKVKAVIHDQSASGATLFVEPLSVVDMNNEYRELQLSERDEERRILAELSSQIGNRAQEIKRLVEGIAELDVVFARAKLAEQMEAVEPQLKTFTKSKGEELPGSTIRLLGARHPLLDPKSVVPIDVAFDAQTYAVIITGPNTGGKTVTLKTVGLLVLMAQSGFHVPSESGSEISVYKDVFADIGDEQSIEQSLSTFSAHITNIIRILNQADSRCLVLLDELGSGTDPQEGAALAKAILSELLKEKITTLVATHYPELKTYALSQKGVVNASVEFDIETLKPTYHLILGLPGSSNALTIAERLGLPESVVESARSGIHPDELRSEDLLSEIQQQRDLIRRAREEAERARSEAAQLRDGLTERLENIEEERREVLEEARLEAEERLDHLEKELEEVRQQIKRARKPLEEIQEIEAKIEALEDEVSIPVEVESREEELGSYDIELQPGTKVRLRSLGSQHGVISEIDDDEVEVQIGNLRLRTRLSELQPVGLPSEAPESGRTIRPTSKKPRSLGDSLETPGIELDLRGQRVEGALETLDRYLDSVYLAELPWVRIIHGKGTGRLRDAVRDTLRGHPHVASYEAGGYGEVGDGVTVVKLRL